MSKANQDRLIEGLSVVSMALQSGQRELSLEDGVSPTQASVLMLLGSKRAKRVRELAIELGVSQPTVTESVAALLAKRLAEKSADPEDGRASILELTAAGRKLVANRPLQTENIQLAVAGLGTAAQSELMVLVTATIRALQSSGAVAPQRQCVSCKYFRPYAHAAADKLHHCAFVDSAFGNAEMRFQCGDHEAASLAGQSANWLAFASRAENLRATLEPPKNRKNR